MRTLWKRYYHDYVKLNLIWCKLIKREKENKLIKDTFSESNNELNELLEEFDIFEFNDKKFEELKKKADVLRIKFNNIMWGKLLVKNSEPRLKIAKKKF